MAVVKAHPAEDQMMSWQMTADGPNLINLPLEQMICSAWDMKPYQLSGLFGWMKSSKFDLTAKVSAEDAALYQKLNTAQHREMLQKLLMERFPLKVHTDMKTLPVYDLVVDRSGSKLKLSTAVEAPSEEEQKAHPEKYQKGFVTMGPGMFEGTGVPLRSLASQLSNALNRPVRDATGLTGAYDIKLPYRQEEVPAGSENGDVPSVFSAVQEQIGLKLVAKKRR